MSEPFLSEIRLFGFNFAPRSWATCDGQILPISQNQSLYSLLGTTYGGDGRTSFALPDLRGRVPIHVDAGHSLGQRGGEETHVLSAAEMPTHTHTVSGTSVDGSQILPANNLLARSSLPAYAAPAAGLEPMAADEMSTGGGGQAHQNMQPFLTLNFCIALQGLFPSRN